MSDPRYADGDVVWCKCGGLYWPGEVKGLDSLPTEIRDGFLRMPLVVVKFFDEDGYEFVLNDKDIFPYSCEKKEQFILKGLARFRTKAKEGATDGWFAKFPKDVIHCEKLTGGNPDILTQEPFADKKEVKVDYGRIFGDQVSEKEKKSKPGSKSTPSTPSEKKNKPIDTKKTPSSILKVKIKKKTEKPKTPPKITHPRFLQGSDHKVRILAQPSTPYHIDTESKVEPKNIIPNYRCHMCDFAASRLNVIVLHSKSHSASKISYAPKPEDLPTKIERSKPSSSSSDSPARKSKEKFVSKPLKKQDSSSPSKPGNSSTLVTKKPRLTKKQKEEKLEKEKKKEEEKKKLLIDWSEDENEEAEEFKKIQNSINQSILNDFSDDDDLLKTDDHHYSMDSDDDALLINSSATSNGYKSPVKLDYPTISESENKIKPQISQTVPSNSSLSPTSKPAQPVILPSPSSTLKHSTQSKPETRPSPQSKSEPKPSPKSKPEPKPSTKVEDELEFKVDDIVVREKRKASYHPESSPKKINKVEDMFDIDQALEETSVPDLPAFPTMRQNIGKNGRKEFPSISALSENKTRTRRISGTSTEDQSLHEDGPRDISSDISSPSKRPGIFKQSNNGSIQLPTRPDENAQLIRDSSGKGSNKFASISAKIKAKQLARAALLTQKQSGEGEQEKPVPDQSSVQSTPEPSKHEEESAVSPRKEKISDPVEPVPAGDQVLVVGEDQVGEEGGDEQIYYMLVDDGSQLENQTILIDESQLSRAGGHHALLQGGLSGPILVQSGADGEIVLQSGAGSRAVLLQNANGELVNFVVADDKDLPGAVVTSADTTGGIATLPAHPSSTLHSQVPLISTPSCQQPIMVTSTKLCDK